MRPFLNLHLNIIFTKSIWFCVSLDQITKLLIKYTLKLHHGDLPTLLNGQSSLLVISFATLNRWTRTSFWLNIKNCFKWLALLKAMMSNTWKVQCFRKVVKTQISTAQKQQCYRLEATMVLLLRKSDTRSMQWFRKAVKMQISTAEKQ